MEGYLRMYCNDNPAYSANAWNSKENIEKMRFLLARVKTLEPR